MRLYEFHREQLIKRPRDEVFSFFEQPENLSLVTPSKLGFVILTPSPIEMHSGTVIDYTVRVFGIRRHWTTLITDYRRPEMFVDVQLKGPYTFWHHTHKFIETGEGTLMTDDVRYVMPLSILGRLMRLIVVKYQLKNIFDFRSNVIEKYFSENVL